MWANVASDKLEIGYGDHETSKNQTCLITLLRQSSVNLSNSISQFNSSLWCGSFR